MGRLQDFPIFGKNPDMYLKGKTVLITGISKGIGKSLTLQLLDRGVTVIGWGLTSPAYSHPDLHFISCDVSEETAVQEAFTATLKLTDSVDFLVNNAGFGYFSPIETFSTERFKKMWEVNVFGAFLVTKVWVPKLKEQASGHIVNVSSIAGRVGMAQGEGYNSSKFGLRGMSESLFNELRHDGIKVTTVYPGSTQTQFFDEIPGFDAHDRMIDPEELAAAMLNLMDTSPNFLVREIEIRPLSTKKKS